MTEQPPSAEAMTLLSEILGSCGKAGLCRFPPCSCTESIDALIAQRVSAETAEIARLNKILDTHSKMMHPWYGPCDAFGPEEQCAECLRVLGRDPFADRPAPEGPQKEDLPRRIGVEQSTQETDRPVGGAVLSKRSLGFRDGMRRAIQWLHDRATYEMNDPNAKAILNTAAFQLGGALSRGEFRKSGGPSALASTGAPDCGTNQRERPRPVQGGESAEGRGAAQAAPAPTIDLPELDGEWDYKGDDPAWQILYRWLKHYQNHPRLGAKIGELFARGDGGGLHTLAAAINARFTQPIASTGEQPAPAAVVDRPLTQDELDAFYGPDDEAVVDYTERALQAARDAVESVPTELWIERRNIETIAQAIAPDFAELASAVASEREAAAICAFGKRIWSDTEEVAYQAGVSAAASEHRAEMNKLRALCDQASHAADEALTMIDQAALNGIACAKATLLARLQEPDVREAVARAMCKRRNTKQCAAICLSHSSPVPSGECTEAQIVWGEDAGAALTKIAEMLK